tara:strand:+ start:3447 stop:4961 length:1515 start_codon:yes stop_codon:yes gene_type:complete
MIKLIENSSRGFFSNYISILTSLRYFDSQGIDLNTVRVGSTMFSLYGEPTNWISEKFVTDSGEQFNTQSSWDLSIWPNCRELDLLKYVKYIPFNTRIKKLLSSDTRDYSNCLGVHYRGTDGVAHTHHVTVDKFLKSIDCELKNNSYDFIFLATDQSDIPKIFDDYFSDRVEVVYNDHQRTMKKCGLHYAIDDGYGSKSRVLSADEVLIDATTLSKCKTLVGKTSNITNYARILNPDIDILYQDLDTKRVNNGPIVDDSFPQIRLSDIQPFIFNWRNQFEKTCAIEDSLKEIFGEVTVINSDENNTREGWVDLGDEAYFTMQFRTALDLLKPEKKVLMHCQGDTVFEDYEQLVKDARKYYNLYEWGVYAPDVTNVWYTPEHTDIDGIVSEDKNIKMVACTDETVWFIHRDIIDEYYVRGLPDVMTHERMKMGWGWDLVMNGISFLKGRPVIRDYAHQIQHAKGTNYDKSSAGQEMGELWSSIQDDLKECISYIKGDREKLIKYFS